MTELPVINWARGEKFGLDLPAHIESLRDGGPTFLTQAFRESGVLWPDNSVTQISSLDQMKLGGTGSKALLSVTYERDVPGLSQNLFV
ncbi:hypothetical protein, partial [Novosphingobium sp. 9U]|uniref:hypothetical protein n=1 Tax=Novosphingobium sp. 9U TaxID=2653158 RepID=UPI001914F194